MSRQKPNGTTSCGMFGPQQASEDSATHMQGEWTYRRPTRCSQDWIRAAHIATPTRLLSFGAASGFGVRQSGAKVEDNAMNKIDSMRGSFDTTDVSYRLSPRRVWGKGREYQHAGQGGPSCP